jgi:hypothetical protein
VFDRAGVQAGAFWGLSLHINEEVVQILFDRATLKTMRVLMGIVFTAMLASAADVSGNWSGKTRLSINGRVEEDTIYLSLKQNAGAISGTAGPTLEQQAPIRTGKIEGSHITLEVPIPDGVFKIDANLEGDHLKGEVVAIAQGQTIKAAMDATKVK